MAYLTVQSDKKCYERQEQKGINKDLVLYAFITMTGKPAGLNP